MSTGEVNQADYLEKSDAAIAKELHSNKLTDSDATKKEATEAIKTVIANYGYSEGYSYFRSQVGAAIASKRIVAHFTIISITRIE